MPYSTALLLPSNLKHIAPVVYKTATELKQGFKVRVSILLDLANNVTYMCVISGDG